MQTCLQHLQENTHLFPKSVQFKVVGSGESESGYAFPPTKAYVNAVQTAVIGMIAVAVVTFIQETDADKIPYVVKHSLASITGNLYSQRTPNDEAVDTLAETQMSHKSNREADPFMISEVISKTAKGDVQAVAKKVIDAYNRRFPFNKEMRLENTTAVRTKNILSMDPQNRKKLAKASRDVDKW